MKPEHAATLKQDMLFADNHLGTKTINDKTYLTINDEIGTASGKISERELVEKWLFQFALGYVGDRNYFDFDGWRQYAGSELRDGVVVYSDADPKKELFVIPAFIDIGLTANEAAQMTQISRYMSHAQGATDHHRSSEILRDAKTEIHHRFANRKFEIRDSIPKDFYEKYGLNVDVVRQMIYCRDRFGLTADTEAWRYTQHVFETMQKDKVISQAGFDFMITMTQNEFMVPDDVEVKAGLSKTKQQPSSIDHQIDEC